MMIAPTRRQLLAPALIALTLVASACGGGGTSSSRTRSTDRSTDTNPAPGPAASPSDALVNGRYVMTPTSSGSPSKIVRTTVWTMHSDCTAALGCTVSLSFQPSPGAPHTMLALHPAGPAVYMTSTSCPPAAPVTQPRITLYVLAAASIRGIVTATTIVTRESAPGCPSTPVRGAASTFTRVGARINPPRHLPTS